MHPAALPADDLLAEIEVSRLRAGGPGGQRRNKVQTGCRMVHRATGLAAEASERRSFEANRKVALGRLRRRLAVEVRGPAAPSPSALWARRTAGPRLSVSGSHEDVPALLAEALDALAAHRDEVPAAASALGVTPSRLLRVLALEPAALAALNRRRRAAGLHVLKA